MSSLSEYQSSNPELGWTSQDVKVFLDLLKKANGINLNVAIAELGNEINSRRQRGLM